MPAAIKTRAALRSSEWLLIGYFGYVALITPLFPLDPQIKWLALAVLVLVASLLLALVFAESYGSREIFSIARDWIPLALTLIAYREMDWFSPLMRNFDLELHWLEWDRKLLHGAGLQRAIEWLGVLLPAYLEFCYLLVYAVGPISVALLYGQRRRELVNYFLLLYLAGTLLAYALLPYFPSDPPRTLFGESDLPNVITPMRRFNLWILRGYGIHSSVFPSAHVSSAFSAAWALFWLLPEKRKFGWMMLVYAVSVAVATIYGRYHYAADAVAGLGVSVIATLMILPFVFRLPRRARGLP
ncbi:MAG TPA: phosphatase PAP2 family protein [Bryobacteraceae bacterium]|jgi:membrane-associated phospholipid phosphatase|nr:phosphatase PAP2 family protein [Bryobacteraceae bacterium]